MGLGRGRQGEDTEGHGEVEVGSGESLSRDQRKEHGRRVQRSWSGICVEQ